MTQKTALVATVRGVGPSLHPFVYYHLHLGFDRLYLFFDDPHESVSEAVASCPQVSIIFNDVSLQAMWEKTRFYRHQKYAKRRLYLMDRQQLNVAVAIQLALQEKIDWLMHLDQDELVYAPEFFQSPGQKIGELFQNLADRQIHYVNFYNHEALVDQRHCTDPFQQIMLFKRNLHTVSQKNFTPQQAALIASVPQLPENFFFNYGNGKSAARVSGRLLPDGVHDFCLPQQQRRLVYWQRRLVHNRLTEWVAGRSRLIHQLRQRLLEGQFRYHVHSKNPVILHYYNCNFEEFWRKYHNFGYFSQFEDKSMLRRLSRFQVEAHQIVQSGDKKEAKAFYEERVIITDSGVVEQLIEAGLVCRINEPALWMSSSF